MRKEKNDSAINTRVSFLIREARKNNNMSQNDLAKEMGQTQQAIAAIENGQRSIGVEVLNAVADALNCELKIHLKPLKTKGK